MISLIESLFGISVPKWVIEAVLVALVLGGAVLYLEHRGAARELATLQRSSAKVLAQAHDQITKDAQDYAAAQKANQELNNAAIESVASLQSQLDQRVRDFAAYRRAHPDVAGTAREPGATSAGECGARSCGDIAQELAERGTELAGSAGQAAAALGSCQRDRDSLTGKP